MNIANKLQELTAETISFGEVISHSKNPSDIDFRDACKLFSQHLSYQLNVISADIHPHNNQPEILAIKSQLNSLNKLIDPNQARDNIANDWNNNLVSFFSKLQKLRVQAA